MHLLLPCNWNSYSRMRSAGAATAHISWFSPPSQPSTTRLTALTCCQASCRATTSSATWTQQANTQRIQTRITLQYPHWSVCWPNTISFPSLLSPTTPTHTTRLVDFIILLYLKLCCLLWDSFFVFRVCVSV